MKKGLFALALAIGSVSAAPPARPDPLPAAQVPPDYRVGPGDVLEISVWKEEELNKQALVRPDGGITFPLIGEIPAGGRTVDQIKREVVRRLADYVSDPEVSVALVTINQKIYVVGKVNKPGEFVTPDRVSVMQALSMAGGLTPFADNDDIVIIRHIGGRETVLPFDYDAVANGNGLEQNIWLQRGDVVVVP
jgi:polysaccharide export outer membrane protein